MNEPTLMFDDAALDAARARRFKVLGGMTGMAALAAVAVSAVVFTTPDSETTELSAPLPAAATAEPFLDDRSARSEAETETSPEGDEPPRTFEVFSSKNPFLPLVDTTPATAAGAATAAPAGGTVAPPTDVATPPVTLVPEAGAAATAVPPARTTEPRAAQRIQMVDVFTNAAGRQVANVKVNDTVHEVGEGDGFATSYKVVSLSQGSKCGQFLYGDDAFQLCVGEELLK